MSGYTINTVEFESEDDVLSEEEMPRDISRIIRDSEVHGNYISIVEDIDSMLEFDLEEEEILEKLFQLPHVKRIAVCQCNDTSGVASFKLYEYDDSVQETDYVADTDVAESLFSSWEVKPESATFGKPSRKYLKEKHGFDGWTIWQIWY